MKLDAGTDRYALASGGEDMYPNGATMQCVFDEVQQWRSLLECWS